MPRITALYIYPIKSCAGISLAAARLGRRGLDGDRRYMLVDAKGRFLTQREHPKMALIGVAQSDDGYRVSAPGVTPLDLPRSLAAGRECRVRIWRDTVDATLAEPDVNRWFSALLSFDCGLVHMAEHQHRPVQHAAAEFDDEVSFADGAPVLVISAASLAWLNRRLPRSVTMQRFRPNLVVTAEQPFAEDDWPRIASGEVELERGWSCPRCVLTTIDPATGVKDAAGEPLATLKQHRRAPGGVMFGQNFIPRKLGDLRVDATMRTD